MSSKTPQPSNPATTSQVTPESTDKDGDIAMGGIEDPKEITVTETLKVAMSDRFTGNRQELETFLLQLEIYFQFNQDKFNHDADKSVWAAFYLRGEAAKWIQPYLKNYFTNLSEPKKRLYLTQTTLGKFEGFKKEYGEYSGISMNCVALSPRSMASSKHVSSQVRCGILLGFLRLERVSD
ncbi:predicted protein [Sclerotinia sclerotiorum 1980 UF-70]|uniref:DUF4939 domain-containing protein n=2 Tax=Sclerotinia sclerotiorum (strain ATCC 18683 / 1980 / Ss-1) TaxID=665079 RepID=A7EJX6_SCLS1|nr:predicted protein [Sclerotinia sclerotiorum 1980 UF-70]APA10081.1 hypothetical protein sscle_05g048510 [Sclerotinia sclerotiorum 1980 UF-70]EDO03142.1 predicted protein [Sclerotinia sclerotiorum 1980 UF-70]